MNALLTATVVFVAMWALVACTSEPIPDPVEPLPLGGLRDAEIDDPEVQQLARFAVSEMGYEYALVEVTKAQKAVVAGRMFHLDVTVNKIREEDGEVSNLHCQVKIHTQDWKGLIELVEYSCNGAGVEVTGV